MRSPVYDRSFCGSCSGGPFEDADGKTRLTHSVEYQMPGGALINLLFGWILKPGLNQMFNHRHRMTGQVCEAFGRR